MLCITCIVTPGTKLWNVTFIGCICDSESEPHTCIVIYRQVSTAVCLWYSTGELSIAVCLWYSTEELCKSQLQCACGSIVLGNSTNK